MSEEVLVNSPHPVLLFLSLANKWVDYTVDISI